jgi:IS5 family transposase
MDGGFVDLKDIQTLEERGIEVYAPPKETKKSVASKNGWEQGWRERMTTQAAKEVYKQRAATAEWANAQVSQHGVSQFRVRGVAKVTAVMLLVVLAHNLLRWAALGT